MSKQPIYPQNNQNSQQQRVNLDDFENDVTLDEEQKQKLRREKAARERKRIRELIRLRRDVEAEKSNAGIWARQAELEFKKRILLPNSLLKTVKIQIVFSILSFIYISWLCGYSTTATRNTILLNITDEDRFLYLIYWSTTWIHLFTIVLMFSFFGRGTVILSILFGLISLIWHIMELILYFTQNEDNNNNQISDAIMYWVEMILNIILILCSLQILIRVDFIPLSPEEIEKIEIEELKHKMEIAQQQRLEKKQKAQQLLANVEQNDFTNLQKNGPNDMQNNDESMQQNLINNKIQQKTN